MELLVKILAHTFVFLLIISFFMLVLQPFIQVYQDQRDERLSKKRAEENDQSDSRNESSFANSNNTIHIYFHFKKEAK